MKLFTNIGLILLLLQIISGTGTPQNGVQNQQQTPKNLSSRRRARQRNSSKMRQNPTISSSNGKPPLAPLEEEIATEILNQTTISPFISSINVVTSKSIKKGNSEPVTFSQFVANPESTTSLPESMTLPPFIAAKSTTKPSTQSESSITTRETDIISKFIAANPTTTPDPTPDVLETLSPFISSIPISLTTPSPIVKTLSPFITPSGTTGKPINEGTISPFISKQATTQNPGTTTISQFIAAKTTPQRGLPNSTLSPFRKSIPINVKPKVQAPQTNPPKEIITPSTKTQSPKRPPRPNPEITRLYVPPNFGSPQTSLKINNQQNNPQKNNTQNPTTVEDINFNRYHINAYLPPRQDSSSLQKRNPHSIREHSPPTVYRGQQSRIRPSVIPNNPTVHAIGSYLPPVHTFGPTHNPRFPPRRQNPYQSPPLPHVLPTFSKQSFPSVSSNIKYSGSRTLGNKPQISKEKKQPKFTNHVFPTTTSKINYNGPQSPAKRLPISTEKKPNNEINSHENVPGVTLDYKINDKKTGAMFSHFENRENTDKVTGKYSVNLPDGRIQTVTYIADKKGYRVKISYEGEAKYHDRNR